MNISSNEIGNLDSFIEQLMTCKPLKESEVKFLCDKVNNYKKTYRRKKFFIKKVMYKLLKPQSQYAVIFTGSFTI